MHRRNAFTLLELIVSLASSIILVAGLAGSLYISNQALSGSANARQSLAASTVLRDLMADVSQANSITERTPRAITFTVPDRDGDLVHEVIRYAWSGVVGDPLTYQYNGSAAVNVATGVQAFNLSALTRELTVASGTVSAPTGVVYEGYQQTKRPTDGTSGTAQGDLLIACVVTDGDSKSSLVAPAGWTSRHVGSGRMTSGSTPAVTLGVWWKLASSSEAGSHNFTWSPSEQAYGWIMRFTGHDSANPINASAMTEGTATSSAPPSPPVTTTVSNAMILRLGGFDANRITVGSPGLTTPSPHVPITMDYSNNSLLGCSGGAGYLLQSTAGSSGTSNFTWTSTIQEEYVTVTIAIAPETAE
jgi:type II secretory pathway pseudopilin PulG